jgi:hypothetical protein
VIKRVVALSLLTVVVRSSLVLAAPKLVPDDLPGPQAEVPAQRAKVDVPPVPAFELPAAEPGFHGPRALRVHGKPSLGTEIKVKGYVTWAYDCAAVLATRNPKATRAQILVSIDTNPALCEYPKFYLGDAKDTARDRSIWVVDVPRAPTKAERQRLSKAELAVLPPVPRVAVGDYVVVTGTWAVQSPRGEHHTDGLLVYKAVARTTPAPPAAAAAAVAAPADPEIAVVTKIPLRKPVDETVRNTSVGKLNECNKAIAARQYDVGMAACEAATKAWDGNHLAWYAWASAHMAKGEWPQATAAVERAVAAASTATAMTPGAKPSSSARPSPRTRRTASGTSR